MSHPVQVQRESHGTGRLAGDVVRYLPAAIVPALCALAGAAYFTRIFTPAAYGVFSLLLSITGPVGTVLAQPAGQAAVRFYSEYQVPLDRDKFGAVIALMAVGIAVAGVAATAVGLLAIGGHGRWMLVAAGGLLVIVSGLGTALLPVLAASFRTRPYIWVSTASAVLSVSASAALVAMTGPRTVDLVLGPVFGGLVVLPAVVRRAQLPRFGRVRAVMAQPSGRRTLVRFLRYGMPLAVWFLLMSLLNSGDRFIVAWLDSTRAVGVYSVSYNLANQGMGLLNLAMITAAWPVLARQWASPNRTALSQSLTAVTTFYATLSFGIGATLLAAAHPLVQLLLGSRFQGGQAVFGPVVAATVLWGAARIGQKSLELAERTTLLVKDAAIATAVSLALTGLLVRPLSYMGAAWATLLGYALYTALVWAHSRRLVAWRVDARRTLGRLGAAVGALLVMKALPQPGLPVLALLWDGSGVAVLYVAAVAGAEWLSAPKPRIRTFRATLEGLFTLSEMV